MLTYAEAMAKYGNDKPDIRFGMEFAQLNDLAKTKALTSLINRINCRYRRTGAAYKKASRQVNRLGQAHKLAPMV